MNITVVLADDHPIVREGMRALLEPHRDITIVGEARDGIETLETVGRVRPDVLLLDLMMPGLNGLEVARRVSGRGRTRVLILSMHASDAHVRRALRNGATGYVLKESRAAELVRAIREVAAGRRYLSTLLPEPVDDLAPGSDADPYVMLTNREREVLQLAAEGCTSAEIGRRLSISPRTAEVHRANLMRKLRLRSGADLVRFAVARDMIPLHP